MGSDQADSDLLLGALAVRTGLLSQQALREALAARAAEEGAPLAEVLRRRGALGQEEQSLLEALAQKHLCPAPIFRSSFHFVTLR